MARRTTSKQRPDAEDAIHATAPPAPTNGKEASHAPVDVPTEDVSSTADTVVDMVMISHTEAMQATGSGGKAVMDGLTKMQQDVTDFVSKRIRHDLETQQELLSCRNFDDLQKVQARFFHVTTEHYTEETKRLMRLASEVVQRSVNREA
jgi:hypothetical protein